MPCTDLLRESRLRCRQDCAARPDAGKNWPWLDRLWRGPTNTDSPPHARSVDDAWLSDALKRAGFDVEEVRPMIPELTMLVEARKSG